MNSALRLCGSKTFLRAKFLLWKNKKPTLVRSALNCSSKLVLARTVFVGLSFVDHSLEDRANFIRLTIELFAADFQHAIV